jgi:hypothetical protein
MLPLSDDAQEAAAAQFDASQAHGRTLAHEVGQWMSLHHPFGDDASCGLGDRIGDTLLFGNQSPDLYNCFQTECGTGIKKRVKNWMSVSRFALDFLKGFSDHKQYSDCFGTPSDLKTTDFRGFTKGERSVMYSHFLTFRQGLKCGATEPTTHPQGSHEGFRSELKTRQSPLRICFSTIAL